MRNTFVTRVLSYFFFFSSRRRHTRSLCDWSSDVISYAVFCLRSEEHTSELQSHSDLVCRLLLEKKKKRGAVNVELQRHEPTCRSTVATASGTLTARLCRR